MDTLGRIRSLGFKKWYERQLIESHLYLVTCFLGIIMAASAVELSARRESVAGLVLTAGLGLAGCVLSFYGWERYKRIMMVAEHIGDHAHCPACRAYARFSVVDAGKALHEEPVNIADPKEVWLKARCIKCGHEWTI